MPNHETNHVVIVGTEEKLKRFREEVIKPTPKDSRNDEFVDFNAIVPQPPNIETGGCSGQHQPGEVCWYQWNVDNWGTKWGAYDYDPDRTEEKDHSEGRLLYLVFQTAWSAPTPVFAAIEEKYGVEVHAWTEDEGGFDPVEYGEPKRFLEIEKRWQCDKEDPSDPNGGWSSEEITAEEAERLQAADPDAEVYYDWLVTLR